jgi:DNA-directed RNA polymerase subunit RPC12/RpoP
MIHYTCDACSKEIEGTPLILSVQELHTGADFRKRLMLCPHCEQQVFFATGNTILHPVLELKA